MLTVVEELIEEFSDLDEREACQILEELGRELPQVPQSIYDKTNLVPGCQSRVWLVNTLIDDPTPRLHIDADSDAFVVKGLIYIVLQMYEGRTLQEVLDTDHGSTFDRLGLGKLILPQRKNGLLSMVKRIRSFAADALGVEAGESLEPSTKVVVPDIVPSKSITSIAEEFPILQQQLPGGLRPIFLDSGASAQKPACVIAKQREVQEQYYANAFRGRYAFGQRVDDEIEASRLKVAQLLGGTRTEEIIFTPGTTASINLVATAWGRDHLGPGKAVVVTEMEHHANFVPWQAAAKEAGAEFKIWPITDEGFLDLERTDEFIGPQTAILAISSMSNVLGTMNPIEDLARHVHQFGGRIFVDAAQSVPHQRQNVVAADIDFLTFSGHKIYGPSGIGVLYGKYDVLSSMRPYAFGGHMIQTVGRTSSTWADLPAKFEPGTMPIVPIIGLGAAIDFVHSIGFEAIERHETDLLEHAHRRLGEIPGLQMVGPRDTTRKGAICSFTVDGVSAEDLAHRLDAQGIFTRHGHHCAMVLHERLNLPATTRASMGVYNSREDLDAFAECIRVAAAELRSSGTTAG